MNEPLIVTAAIIRQRDRYLITQRSRGEYVGMWDFPGEKLKEGETLEECIEREIMEELRIEIRAVDEFWKGPPHQYRSGLSIDLRAYNCDWVSGEIRLNKNEVADYRIPLPHELSGYDLPEADLPLVRRIREMECVL